MISRNFGILYFSYVGMYLHNNPKKFDDERVFLEIQIGNLPLLRSDGILHFWLDVIITFWS